MSDVVNDDLLVSEKLIALIHSMPLASQSKQTDGTVTVTLTFPLHGAFSQLMLPAEIQQIEAVKTLSTTPLQKSSGTTGYAASAPSVRYSGLVIDARGLSLEPALVVRVMDENGEVIYGPGFISRDYAGLWGVAGYDSGSKPPKDQDRLGGAPLQIEALRVAGAGRSDVTISNSAADKIRGLPENVLFFRECRMVIWVD